MLKIVHMLDPKPKKLHRYAAASERCAMMRFGAKGSRATLGCISANAKSRSATKLARRERTVVRSVHEMLPPRSRPKRRVKTVSTSVTAPKKSMRRNLEARSEVSFLGSFSNRETTRIARAVNGT